MSAFKKIKPNNKPNNKSKCDLFSEFDLSDLKIDSNIKSFQSSSKLLISRIKGNNGYKNEGDCVHTFVVNKQQIFPSGMKSSFTAVFGIDVKISDEEFQNAKDLFKDIEEILYKEIIAFKIFNKK